MSEAKLDQIVKGAPQSAPDPGSIRPPTSELLNQRDNGQVKVESPLVAASDPPLSPASSSPAHVYLNLLILEASLRSQYLILRNRRRLNTFFIFLLSAWIAIFSYLLFLRPREDGKGIGGSVYWVVETAEKVAWMGGVVTAILIWGTGQWDRGVRWPRRWLSVANRGLRSINAKVIIIKGPWWKEMLGHFVFLFPYSALFAAPQQIVEARHAAKRGHGDELEISHGEDLSIGGDYVKLLLLPKPFSPDFRENWESYRSDYWEKENERRLRLRESVRKRRIESAKSQSRWLWWTPWNVVRSKPTQVGSSPGERSHSKQSQERDRLRRPSLVRISGDSRNASRSSTPAATDTTERPSKARSRRGSINMTTTERRRKPRPSSSFEIGPESGISPIGRPA